MSCTTLIGWKGQVPYEEIEDYRNSHLWAPNIWGYLAWRHHRHVWGDTPRNERYLLGDDAACEKLWAMATNKRFPKHQRATLACTFDHVVIPTNTIRILASLLRQFAIEMRGGERLWKITDDLIKHAADYTYLGFVGTSVSDDVWMVIPPEGLNKDGCGFARYDLTGNLHYTWQQAMQAVPTEETPCEPD